MPINKIHARQIFDSRGNPTVEVDLYTERGMYYMSSQHELEFRTVDVRRHFVLMLIQVLTYKHLV